VREKEESNQAHRGKREKKIPKNNQIAVSAGARSLKRKRRQQQREKRNTEYYTETEPA
jgi:hypothetical protein